jgi:predicted Zn-dependent protease
MAIEVVDSEQIIIEATHGAAAPVGRSHIRTADVDIRVGSKALDNTHQIRDGGWFSSDQRESILLPIHEGGERVARRLLWTALDDSYRAALKRLIKVRNNASIKVKASDNSPDFSDAPAIKDIRPIPDLVVDEAHWLGQVRSLSGKLLAYEGVHDTNVSLSAQRIVRRIVTTDGTAIRFPETRFRFFIWAGTTADDGMELQLSDYVDARSIDTLPDAATLARMTKQLGERLTQLRSAPVVEPHVGPAILRGRAAAVFFHEVLGHRVEGHRQKDDEEGQTFTDKVGKPVLPPFLSVVDDPTRARIGGVDLSGAYPYDDEGVASEPVTVVQRGVLRNFLMSRSPIEGFSRSNGHGRRQTGKAVVARQGSLIVQAHKTESVEKLEDRLRAEIRRQGKPYGYIFDDITGGFTFTGRVTPNAFSVQPVTVWRVWADGRPNELVRGVDLIGTPLTTFQRILAASDRTEVFNGSCGAESGWVPVSAAAPDLLIEELEIQRSDKAHDRPPILPAPRGTK